MNTSKPGYIRDYNLISPSAKSLVLLKGLTNIPLAKETAELISSPGKYNPDTNNKDTAFWKRVVHFENRYWSIDQLLSQLTITNILELSSGYSFRGLDTVRQKKLQYIDTDLSNVIIQKKDLMVALQGSNADTAGNLTTIPLNALDEQQFNTIVNLFPPGPIIIVNEGLLMYLNITEKENLCKIIYKILKQRGGFWITGDIYIKSTLERLNGADDGLKELTEQQRIEDNMFESFDIAKEFFNKAGFVIVREPHVEHSKLSSLKYLLNNATEAELTEMQAHPKIQTTWCLQVESDF